MTQMNELTTKKMFHQAIQLWYYALANNDKKLVEQMEGVIKVIAKRLDEEDRADYETEH
jgi:hypothetical protein